MLRAPPYDWIGRSIDDRLVELADRHVICAKMRSPVVCKVLGR
jgi:hypothetical protein